MNDVEDTLVEVAEMVEDTPCDIYEAEKVDELSLLKAELEALRMELKSRD